MGAFKKLEKKLELRGYSEEQAGGIAYSAGKKKFGAKVMAEASKKGVSAKSLASGKSHAMAGSRKAYK